MLKIEDITFSYGIHPVIENLSADIIKGDLLGIVGPNGSGKTTLLKIITRILKPSSGKLTLEGENINRIPAGIFAKKISFLPSDIEVSFSYTVEEFIAMGRFPHTGRYGKLSYADIKAIKEILVKFGIACYADRRIWELSDGEKQMVFLAQAVVQNPALLILDEPTSHLDIGHSFRILDIIRELNLSGITVISVLHDLNLASEYCSKLLLLKDGRIFAQGTPEETLTYSNVEEAYNTKVLVYKNPHSGKPYVFGIPANILTEEKEMKYSLF